MVENLLNLVYCQNVDCGLTASEIAEVLSLADKYMLEACCGDFHLDSRDIASNEKRSNPALQPFQAWGVKSMPIQSDEAKDSPIFQACGSTGC